MTPPRATPRRRLPVWALTLAALALAVGCGSDPDPVASTSTVATEEFTDVTSPTETSIDTPPEATATTLAAQPTESDLLNASLPGAVVPACGPDSRIKLTDGAASGVEVLNGQQWDYQVGVGRRNLDGPPLIAIGDPVAAGPSAVMVVGSTCEATGRNILSHLMVCDIDDCEIGTRIDIDEVPFTTTGIVTHSASDLSVAGSEITVDIDVCSGPTGCVTVSQRYRWSGQSISRID